MSRSFLLADVRSQPWLATLDPRVKLAWILAISILSVLVDSNAALVGVFLLGAMPAIGLRMHARSWLVVGGLLLTVAWATALSQAMFFPSLEPPMLTLIPELDLGDRYIPGLYLFRDGAIYGLSQSLRMLASMSAGIVVCLSTSPEQLLAAFERLQMPGLLSFMAVTALRFVPLVIDEYAGVRKARRLRGYRFRLWPPTRIVEGLWLEAAILVPLLTGVLRRSTTLATSVVSRGFQPGSPRTAYPRLTMRAGEWAILAILLGACVAVGAMKWFDR